MVQELDNVDMGAEQAFLARQPLVQPTHLEDGDRSELVMVELELELELDGNFSMAVDQALQPVQPPVQLMLLEDDDKQVQVVLVQATEQVVVEQGSLQLGALDADVEQALEALQTKQPPVQLMLLEDYYMSDHSKLQVAHGQQKDLHYYWDLQEMVQEYWANEIWEEVYDYYEVLINVDALDYPEHDYHAQPVGQQSGLSEEYLEEFLA